ncbi:helix-turn-helix domain-containing protein [Sandaracinobacter neustonicus]|uniref:Helix-turn-helix domain-containing protein n=2 Tax=Sandaracinobacter neustonicus TaxID=1715348 RepID=A0A501XJB5_9SPHN|nr:helix-turn-helix domain-containing protein [Sandaracinobacter neustonicus]
MTHSSPPAACPAVRRTSDNARMSDMLAAARQQEGWEGDVRTDDGWRRPLNFCDGFRHDYDADVATGGWEFIVLRPGLSIAIVDYTVNRVTVRRHRPGDNLVLSAVVSGHSLIDGDGLEGRLAHGYCTLYGLRDGDEFQTCYTPDQPLKYVSVFVERAMFAEVTGLKPDDLGGDLRDFLEARRPLLPHTVPLSGAASLVAAEIADNRMEGPFRGAFLAAKAVELACHILYVRAHSLADSMEAPAFTRADFDRLRRAKALLEHRLDEPLNIHQLARKAGLTRQKLQLGFRLLYGDTVARVRDKARMARALELVRASDLSMIQIALETGYEHPASFTRAFKAAFGHAPLTMRQLAREGVSFNAIAARPANC